ncbi:hypothetical protein FSARC_10173 [Fusarium sarcochroum]|uniref:Uncharacterized protein n=1 Tax=Fusarium sarcochroum TaxID=1208366 RepID=A0A8H4TPF0_9HYPO|nr:hypothetical protein FSARC_10173 [Fusarium sarcochroum]
MAGKSSDWDNADFLVDLVVALYTGAQSNKGLTPLVKEAVEEYLKTRGYTTSFDAVRGDKHARISSSFSSPLINFFPTPEQAAPLHQHSISSFSPFLIFHFHYQDIMAKRQIMTWDANVHEDILICLFQHIKPSPEDWANVMSDLQEKGYTFTEGALRYETWGFSAPSGKPARGWDATSHEDLLLALLEDIKPSKTDLTSVAEKMRSKGYSYSYDAINQHVQKLRKNRDTAGIQNAGDERATPRKPKATPKRTPKKKVKSAATAEDDDDDVEDEKLKLKMEPDFIDEDMPSPSPAKRRRTATPKAEPQGGEELADGEI